MKGPIYDRDADAIAARIFDELDGRIVLGLPLGLGKANRIANALFRRAKANPALSLEIFTALTLEPPTASSDMERRFLEPLSERLFAGYEELDYARALRSGTLPANVSVSEFFLLAGRWLGDPAVQRSYVSANYTHAARVLLDRGVNVIAQLVAKRGTGEDASFSLSCNTDITLDLLPALDAADRKVILAGEVSGALPYMGGKAVLPASRFAHMLETPGNEPRLFATPKQPVSDADHAIGIHVASLVKDGGTLQIGIGSLGDAVAAALVMRHEAPDIFVETLRRLCHGDIPPGRETGRFERGLYAASEMFVDGFMELYRHGILKRRASDGALLHAGFFLGAEDFYCFLRELPDEERDLFQMRGISFVNELYGDEEQKRADRTDARFVNTAMMATLLGSAVSDGLADGRIVSGVGGQYNFVAQAFALDDARSIITLNATRTVGGRSESRVLWNYGHTTIPRHLRDIFITEYGVADLRGKTDRDCVAEMLAICDAAFQEPLLEQAKGASKMERSYRLDAGKRTNTAAFLTEALSSAREHGWGDAFPFGTNFTDEERRLLPALALLRERTASRTGALAAAWSAIVKRDDDTKYITQLRRMRLDAPQSLTERLYRRLLVWALARTESA
ncbi:acetyl-CoA hydrolase/transferase C-terminal domain-containing protein [Mesorhizobium sp. CAU 1741]|uniref:acetyl-CoA hydrolase/transferase C-terminal domain-containing protein n=1 Tax=Mesorhizobium sp. CAU 1741 TaxID=3140366 RepID=UPI00325B18D1